MGGDPGHGSGSDDDLSDGERDPSGRNDETCIHDDNERDSTNTGNV